MADELNQPASSQPDNASGPNGAGKPAEAGGGTMTPSQQSDYYNKTQQLAADRRAFEQERAEFQAKQGRPSGQQGYQPQGPYPQQGPHGQPQGQFWQTPQGYPQGQPGQFPQAPQAPVFIPPNYADLVREFGPEGAQAMVQTLNQPVQLVQQQIAQAEARLTAAELRTLETELNTKGKSLYGESWDKNGKEVMDLIKVHGLKLELAWNAINGDRARQEGADQAYQNQQQKQQAQVGQQGAGPSAQTVNAINDIDDAFNAARKELGF